MGRPEISGVTRRQYFVSLNVTVPIPAPTPFTSMELIVAWAVAAYAVAASANTSVEMNTARRIIQPLTARLWRSILVERRQSCLSRRRVGRPSTVRHAFAIQRRRWRTLKFDAGAHVPPWNDRVRRIFKA